MHDIQFDQFVAIHVLAGTIIKAEPFPKAKKPAYKVWVDFGSIGIKQTSAQITVHYMSEGLVGKKVMGCVNLGTRNIAGFASEFLLLGFTDINGDVLLANVDDRVPNGSKLH